jgi:hypothetical protein
LNAYGDQRQVGGRAIHFFLDKSKAIEYAGAGNEYLYL